MSAVCRHNAWRLRPVKLCVLKSISSLVSSSPLLLLLPAVLLLCLCTVPVVHATPVRVGSRNFVADASVSRQQLLLHPRLAQESSDSPTTSAPTTTAYTTTASAGTSGSSGDNSSSGGDTNSGQNSDGNSNGDGGSGNNGSQGGSGSSNGSNQNNPSGSNSGGSSSTDGNSDSNESSGNSGSSPNNSDGSDSSSKGGGVSVGAIAGIVVGAIVVGALAIIGVVILRRKRAATSHNDSYYRFSGGSSDHADPAFTSPAAVAAAPTGGEPDTSLPGVSAVSADSKVADFQPGKPAAVHTQGPGHAPRERDTDSLHRNPATNAQTAGAHATPVVAAGAGAATTSSSNSAANNSTAGGQQQPALPRNRSDYSVSSSDSSETIVAPELGAAQTAQLPRRGDRASTSAAAPWFQPPGFPAQAHGIHQSTESDYNRW